MRRLFWRHTSTPTDTPSTTTHSANRNKVELQIRNTPTVRLPAGEGRWVVGQMNRGMKRPAGAVTDHHYIRGARENTEGHLLKKNKAIIKIINIRKKIKTKNRTMSQRWKIEEVTLISAFNPFKWFSYARCGSESGEFTPPVLPPLCLDFECVVSAADPRLVLSKLTSALRALRNIRSVRFTLKSGLTLEVGLVGSTGGNSQQGFERTLTM